MYGGRGSWRDPGDRRFHLSTSARLTRKRIPRSRAPVRTGLSRHRAGAPEQVARVAVVSLSGYHRSGAEMEAVPGILPVLAVGLEVPAPSRHQLELRRRQ
jgi:hypothetical protein